MQSRVPLGPGKFHVVVLVEIKFYNLDTFKKQIDVNFIDLDSELVDLNYKVESLIFCHFWRSIGTLLL